MSVRAIFCSVQDIGKNIKKTKRHYVWKFAIGSKEHIIDLFNSTLSGKKKIRVDGQIIYESQKLLGSNFNYGITVGRTAMRLVQYGDKFDLEIDNQPFSQFYGGRGSGLDKPRSYNQPRAGYSDTYGGDYDEGYSRGSNSWNDVKKAASIMKEKNIYNDRDDRRYGDDMSYSRKSRDDAFDNHENKFSNRRSEAVRSSGSNAENFKDSGNLPKPPKMSSRSNTSDFDNFNKLGNKENAAPMFSSNNKVNNANLFVEQVVFDKGITTTTQQNMFAFGSEKDYTFSQPETKITNDLLDFATTNDTTQTANALPPSNVLLTNLYNLYPQQQEVKVEEKPSDDLLEPIIDLLEPAPPKKDLWKSDLVNLKEIVNNADIPNNGQGYNGTNIAPPMMNTNMNMNMNMNNMGNMGGMGGMGNMNSMYNNMQGGMGYNTNMGMGMMNHNMNMMGYGQQNNMSYALVPYGGLGNNMQMF